MKIFNFKRKKKYREMKGEGKRKRTSPLTMCIQFPQLINRKHTDLKPFYIGIKKEEHNQGNEKRQTPKLFCLTQRRALHKLLFRIWTSSFMYHEPQSHFNCAVHCANNMVRCEREKRKGMKKKKVQILNLVLFFPRYFAAGTKKTVCT